MTFELVLVEFEGRTVSCEGTPVELLGGETLSCEGTGETSTAVGTSPRMYLKYHSDTTSTLDMVVSRIDYLDSRILDPIN